MKGVKYAISGASILTTFFVGASAMAEEAIQCSFSNSDGLVGELVILDDRGILKTSDHEENVTTVFLCNDAGTNYTCVSFWENPSNGAIIHTLVAVTRDLKSVFIGRSGPNAPEKAFVSIFPAECN